MADEKELPEGVSIVLINGQRWMRTVIEIESFALQTCKDLVRQGATFTVEKVAGGWRFEVLQESA